MHKTERYICLFICRHWHLFQIQKKRCGLTWLLWQEVLFLDPSVLVFDASIDLQGCHLHSMHLYEEVQLLVEKVMHLTRRESMLWRTYDEANLQQEIIKRVNRIMNMKSQLRHKKYLSYLSSPLQTHLGTLYGCIKKSLMKNVSKEEQIRAVQIN